MRAFVDLVVPSCCDGCGRRAAPPWCTVCDLVAREQAPHDPCRRCAGARGPGHPCWATDEIEALVAITAWGGPVATALTRAKLDGRAEVFRALGPALARVVHGARLVVDVVVPVPTDRRRVRSRGSDHAWELAAATAASLGVPAARAVRPTGRLEDRGVTNAADRRAFAAEALVVPRPASVAGRAVLVVDDLVTTGGTLLAVARAARGADAARVSAAVLARAGAHPLGGGHLADPG